MRDVKRAAPSGDLDTAEEIGEMVRRFYADVVQDDLLGPMFNEVGRVDWSDHLPKLSAFWCRALLGQPGYQGNPFRAHLFIHAQRAFTPAHLERRLTLSHERSNSAGSGLRPIGLQNWRTTLPASTATNSSDKRCHWSPTMQPTSRSKRKVGPEVIGSQPAHEVRPARRNP